MQPRARDSLEIIERKCSRGGSPPLDEGDLEGAKVNSTVSRGAPKGVTGVNKRFRWWWLWGFWRMRGGTSDFAGWILVINFRECGDLCLDVWIFEREENGGLRFFEFRWWFARLALWKIEPLFYVTKSIDEWRHICQSLFHGLNFFLFIPRWVVCRKAKEVTISERNIAKTSVN